MRILGPRCFNDWDTFTPNGPGSINGSYQTRVPDVPSIGDEDRWYVSSYLMTYDSQDWNYYLNIGTQVGVNTWDAGNINDETRSFTIGGGSFPLLESGKMYFLFCARFDSIGNPVVGTWQSDNEVIITPDYENRVFPANGTVSYDPAVDDFNDCFKLEISGLALGAMVGKGSDADGDYWEVYGEGINNIVHWNGLDFISPEYPFTMEFKIKHNYPGSSDGNDEKNMEIGLKSGCQYNAAFNYYRAHHAFDGETGETWFFGTGPNANTWNEGTPDFYDDWDTVFTPQPAYHYVGIRATIQNTYTNGDPDPDPKTAYLIHPHPTSHPEFSKRVWNQNVINTLRWEYTGDSPGTGQEAYTFYGYLNGTLIITLGDIDKPIFTRRRHYAGEHLKYPINLQMWNEKLGGHGAGYSYKIYNITVTSECPYAFSSWLPYDGDYGSGTHKLYKVDDAAGNVRYGLDPDSSVTNVTTAGVNAVWPQGYGRATTQMTAGYTKSHSDWAPNGEAWPIWLAAKNWTSADHGTVTVYFQPTTLPADHKLQAVKFIGNAVGGTVKGRLLNEARDTALTSWSANLASAHTPVAATVTGNDAVVRPEFEIVVNGFTTPQSMQQDSFTEKTPAAEAVLMYFIPTVVDRSRAGDQLTLTAWSGATIYYSIDGAGFTTYTGPITLGATDVYVDYYGDDGIVTSDTVRYTIDRNAPTTSASLESGVYRTSEVIVLTATDDEDSSPTIKYRWRDI